MSVIGLIMAVLSAHDQTIIELLLFLLYYYYDCGSYYNSVYQEIY